MQSTKTAIMPPKITSAGSMSWNRTPAYRSRPSSLPRLDVSDALTRREAYAPVVGYLVWTLVTIQGLPLLILGAVNHNRTLEIIGIALLVLFSWTGWGASVSMCGGWLIPGPAARLNRLSRARRAASDSEDPLAPSRPEAGSARDADAPH